MYRRLGSKHLFQKLDGSSSLPRCNLAKMIRKHPLLVLLSVLCKSLQRSLIFIALPFSACALFGKAGAKVRRFLIPSKCFERKVCESWQFFALFYKTRVKRGYFWEKGRKKGKAVVREQAVHICHYREISAPLSFNYFLLIIYRGRKDEKKGQDGQRKGADGGKSLAYPLRGRPKSLRQSFGMVSGWVRDGKPHANKQIPHASQATGPPHSNRFKSGVKNEYNFVAL